jgi:hypothetical protein
MALQHVTPKEDSNQQKATLILCVCVITFSSHTNFSNRTYETRDPSFILQATALERGQRFLLATLGDTASWGIRQHYEIFFHISWLLISVHPTTIGYSQS